MLSPLLPVLSPYASCPCLCYLPTLLCCYRHMAYATLLRYSPTLCAYVAPRRCVVLRGYGVTAEGAREGGGGLEARGGIWYVLRLSPYACPTRCQVLI